MGRRDRRLVFRTHGALSGARGFTLLEAVATLALVAALAAVAVLAQRDLFAALRLHWAGQQVALELQRARLRAVAENTDFRVVFDVGSNRLQVQRDSGSEFVDVGAATLLPGGIRTAHCSAPGHVVRFRPRGNAATFGTITLRSDAGRERRVIVNIAGRVRVEG